MIGIDTSFLVAFEISSHPHHVAARKIAEHHRGEGFGCAPQVLAEFLHVVTDRKRFERPLSIPQALNASQRWWDAVETWRVVPTSDAVSLFLQWMRDFQLSRKRILDTLLAATYKAANIALIVTTDARDFSHFPGMHPLILS
jgi:predicted nucleic acid-binding protein